MSQKNNIRAVGEETPLDADSELAKEPSAQAPELDDTLDLDAYEDEPEAEAEPQGSQLGWLAPGLALLAIAAWTGFYVWAMQAAFVSALAAPGEWVRLIVDWAVPVLLVGVVWLLTMRHSRVEARRFADSAALLSRESRELEDRLIVVNRELSLAREFLSAQSRDLEALGRVASERISTHADSLQSLIKENGAQVEAIGSASESALANMTRLRDDLPVVANSARDVTNQVGAAGRTAHEHLQKLVTGFERLNQFGKASESQTEALDKRVSETLERFQTQLDAIETTAGNRLNSVREQADAYRGEVQAAQDAALEALRERMTMLQAETKAIATSLRNAETEAMKHLATSKDLFEAEISRTITALDKQDAEAIKAAEGRVANLQHRIDALTDHLRSQGRSFAEGLSRLQEEFSTHEAQASEILAQRLSDLDDALAERREAQIAETAKLVENSEAVGAKLEELSSLIGRIEAHGQEARSGLSAGMEALETELEAKRHALRETETQLGELTEAGIRLLEIIQSGARFTREDLSAAIETAQGSLSTVEERSQAVAGVMLSASEKANNLESYLIEAQAKIADTDGSIEALHAKIAEQSEDALAKIQGLRSGFAQLADESTAYSSETQDQLREALDALEQSTRNVFETLGEGAREKVDALSQSLSQRAVAELERSLRNNSAEAVGKLEQAAAHASGVGREATKQLRDQLSKVSELTLNLEQRIARARELAEEQVSNDFTRRMALITDSLNSSAIDITNALSTEVSDTSWDAYLKGDRGIFTRRAVRLIDSGEAREIAELYQRDEAFKGNVNRYIHDFEAMLRQVLSTREGNALGVTMLGADVGKLYVVLAQSIERFRQ